MFVERNREHCNQLEALKRHFPALGTRADILHGDANVELQALCRKRDWQSTRAVLFLDPYGMQVEWETIAAVAETRAIDTWILFPLGIGVNRLLPRSGEIPEGWRRRLDRLLGTSSWFDDFYRIEKSRTLFGSNEETVKQASSDTIGRYFLDRLRTVFAAVSGDARVLTNSSNCPLYLLCFAVANERAADLALRIAKHTLVKGLD